MDRSILDSVYNEAINIRFKERRKKKHYEIQKHHTPYKALSAHSAVFVAPGHAKLVVNYFNFLKLRFGLINGQERKTKTFDGRSVPDLVAYIKNVD